VFGALPPPRRCSTTRRTADGIWEVNRCACARGRDNGRMPACKLRGPRTSSSSDYERLDDSLHATAPPSPLRRVVEVELTSGLDFGLSPRGWPRPKRT